MRGGHLGRTFAGLGEYVPVVADYASEFFGLKGFTSALKTLSKELCKVPDPLDPCGTPADGAGSGLAIEMGGDALAKGQHTRALGTTTCDVTDLGAITIARGMAEFGAASRAPKGDQRFADAITFAEVEGADFVFTYTLDNGRSRDNRCEGWTVDTSETYVFAIDIEGFEFEDGPIEIDCYQEKNNWRESAIFGCDFDPWRMTGHRSEVDATAYAYGDDTFTETDTASFSTTSLSSAFGIAIGVVGG